jgi:predicted glycosyltransferase
MTSSRLENARVLMYSHDTFGLGHLRRCREIAHALVQAYRGLSVMIISGATIAGAFDYRVRVDFVKVPSVIKLHNGEYQSMARHTSLDETLKMRRSIIRHTAESFRPDIFITDKEPMGLHGEIEETLAYLKAQGTRLVLGLREVMDAPELLGPEWARKDLLRKIEQYYDSIWVYGPEGFYDPLEGLLVPPAVRARMRYMGFLRRTRLWADEAQTRHPGAYMLVTTGGGGDGAELFHAVFAAHRVDPGLQHALAVLGPYVSSRDRAAILADAAGLPNVEVIEFDNRMEDLIANASCVVGMGGYNTFCEILSFDRPALIVPRTQPRLEQAIRAERAAELGLARMMAAEDLNDAPRLAAALRALPDAPRPSQSVVAAAAGMLELDGLTRISEDVGDWLRGRQSPAIQVVQART